MRGDLVRAEVLQIDGNGSTQAATLFACWYSEAKLCVPSYQVQVLRRDDALKPKMPPAAWVVRVLTNKKALIQLAVSRHLA